MDKFLKAVGILILLSIVVVSSQAITIDMVTVGNPGNAADTVVMYDGTSGYGSVGYTYSIGKCEITAGQYTAFLNAVATTSDPYGLYNDYMASTNKGSTINYNSGTHLYSAALPNEPVNYVSWGDAARFCNWLANGQPTTGVENLSTTEDGSYYLNGATTDSALWAVNRKPNATWVIPSENEWYKAAYYDPNKNNSGIGGYWLYASKSDTPPNNVYPTADSNSANYYKHGYPPTISGPPYTTEVGSFTNSKSAYGTLDQDGNVEEWTDTSYLWTSGSQIFNVFIQRGGMFSEGNYYLESTTRVGYEPSLSSSITGFRVAIVPEPGSITLLVCVLISALIWRKRRI